MYLTWYDGDKKKSVSLKILEGVSRYNERFSTPNIVLLNILDLRRLEKEGIIKELLDLELRPCSQLAVNNFFIGYEEKEVQVKTRAS